MPSIIDSLKKVTVGQMLRLFTAIATPIALAWVFAGPIVKSYAADALLDVLIQQGVDPESIKQMQAQGIANGDNIKKLTDEAEKIKADVQELSTQLGTVSGQITRQQSDISEVKDDVDRLVEILLRRADAPRSPTP